MFQKYIIALTVFFSISVQASDSWKKISQSFKGCGDKYEIYAKVGEPFIKLKLKEKWIELKSLDQLKFQEESPMQLRYFSTQYDYEYVQPSLIDGNLPRLIIKKENRENCKMLPTMN